MILTACLQRSSIGSKGKNGQLLQRLRKFHLFWVAPKDKGEFWATKDTDNRKCLRLFTTKQVYYFFCGNNDECRNLCFEKGNLWRHWSWVISRRIGLFHVSAFIKPIQRSTKFSPTQFKQLKETQTQSCCASLLKNKQIRGLGFHWKWH